MKIPQTVKEPFTLMLQNYGYQGEDHLALGLYLGFSLEGAGILLSEQDAWQAAVGSLMPFQAEGVTVDRCMGKPVGEFFAAGFAHTDPQNMAGVTVRLRVGGIARDFLVMGEQYLGKGAPGAPLPFKSLPLGWAQTALSSDNPLGMGSETIGSLGQPLAFPLVTDMRRGPNGEALPTMDPNPVAASPLPRPFGPDFSKAGVYGDDWLKEAWPGLPRGFDFSSLNLAQHLQRLSSGFFRGDEEFYVSNMHPEKREFRGSLPGVRPRLFVRLSQGPGPGQNQARNQAQNQSRIQGDPTAIVKELSPVLDTVWLFPSYGAGLLIWHASIRVRDGVASEVREIIVGHEPLGQEQPAAGILADAERGFAPVVVGATLEPTLEQPQAPPQAPPVQPPLEEARATQAPAAAKGIPGAPMAAPGMAEPQAPPQGPQPIAAPEKLESAESIMAMTREDLRENLPEYNENLKKLGMPTLTMEELEPYLIKEEAELKKVIDAANSASKDPADIKKLAVDSLVKVGGLSPERAANVLAAHELELPIEENFASEVLYEEALDNHASEWARLMGFPKEEGVKRTTMLRASRDMFLKGKPEAMEKLLQYAVPQADAKAVMAKLELLKTPMGQKAEALKNISEMGFDPAKIEGLLLDMDELGTQFHAPFVPFKEKAALMHGFGAKVEKALGMAEGSTKASIENDINLTRDVAFKGPSLGENLAALAKTTPGLSPYLKRLEELRMGPDHFDSILELGEKAGITDRGLLERLKPVDPLNYYKPEGWDEQQEARKRQDEEILKAAREAEDAAIAERLAREMAENSLVPPSPKKEQYLAREEVEAYIKHARSKGEIPSFAGSVLSALDLSGMNLSGLDISGADLSDCDLSGCDLTGALLRSSMLSGAKLGNALLAGANLNGSGLQAAKAPGCDFGASDLSYADMSKADLRESTLRGAKAVGAQFNGTLFPMDLSGCQLAGASFTSNDLSSRDLRGAELSRASFTDCDLTGADLSDAVLERASLDGTRALKARFRNSKCHNMRGDMGSDFSGADFSSALLSDGGFSDCAFRGADFLGARLDKANFQGLDMSGSLFVGAWLKETLFHEADLTGCDFTGADLFKASLAFAKLAGASFMNASLYGSNLFKARIDERTLFLGADLNSTCLSI
ncbi:MAG: pentapeptide repeat-containing protein [Deltaproteobacteria bacterium]|jgi:uncharacterized protein YjbI with pentapeptide repeats|nr:pentapeptide repeat-containing protein [Deltaproteobacteria bacterium]